MKDRNKIAASVPSANVSPEDLLATVEAERRRIGRDLHDNLGQQLTGISFLLKVLETTLSKKVPEEIEGLEKLQRLVAESIRHTRNLSQTLCPTNPEPHGLAGSMEALARRTEEMYRVDCEFRSNAEVPGLSDPESMQLYQIAQESLLTLAGQGHAGPITLELRGNGPDLCLIVRRGRGNKGNEPEQVRETQVRVMTLRAEAMGWAFRITNTESGGTEFTCSVPCESIEGA